MTDCCWVISKKGGQLSPRMVGAPMTCLGDWKIEDEAEEGMSGAEVMVAGSESDTA